MKDNFDNCGNPIIESVRTGERVWTIEKGEDYLLMRNVSRVIKFTKDEFNKYLEDGKIRILRSKDLK